MDNSGKLLGAQINREWFLYQEKEVFAEYRQKRLTGKPGVFNPGGRGHDG